MQRIRFFVNRQLIYSPQTLVARRISLLPRSYPLFLGSTYQLAPSSNFHSSCVCLKKASKGGKGKNSEADDIPIELPDVKRYDKSMENTVNWFSSELNKLKLGRISPDFFSDLPVDSYGTVGKAGQVTMKTPSKLVVAVYDPAIANSVAEALKKCGLGLSPQVEGSNVSATIPKPSKEARDLMIKNAGKLAEKVKNDIRNVRKNALDEFKHLKNKISDDDIKRLTKEVDNFATARASKIDQLLKTKEKEIHSLDD